MKYDWAYNGDISLRHGGFYWKPIYDDCVEAVDVFPLEEHGDNIFGVVSDSIYMPEDKYKTALDCCGYVWLPKTRQIVDCTGHAHTDTLPLLVDAFKAYWGLSGTYPRIFKIQIGGARTHPHDYRIAHNASLRRFVEREFLQ